MLYFSVFWEIGLMNNTDRQTNKLTTIMHLAHVHWDIIIINIGYTMKRRGIRDLDHCGNRLFRRPEHVARGRLIRFPRWSKSRILRLFHRIRYLYHTSLSVCLSASTKYCSSVLEVYWSWQDRSYWRPANTLGQRVVWMITLVIAPSLYYFPVVV